MENTTKKYTNEYYKASLDVIAKWVEFQNEFGRIENTSSFNFGPILYGIKEQVATELELYLENTKKTTNTSIVRNLIIKMLSEKLTEAGYPHVVPYLSNISEEKQIELINTVFMRRSILTSLSNLERIKIENTSEINKLINTYLSDLRWLRVSTSFSHPDFSENLAPLYLEMLPISHDEEKSSISYMSQCLFFIKRIECLYREIALAHGDNKDTIEDISEDIDILQSELDEYFNINSFRSLILTIGVFDLHIHALKSLTTSKEQPNVLKLTSNQK